MNAIKRIWAKHSITILILIAITGINEYMNRIISNATIRKR